MKQYSAVNELRNTSKISVLPKFTARSVDEIDFGYLNNIGVKACFFDIDHTILRRGSKEISLDIQKKLNQSNIDIYIATNRVLSDEVTRIANLINAEGIMYSHSYRMFKPRKSYFNALIDMTGMNADQIAMIGDRIVQDIWGANRVGINTVLVNKLGSQTFIDKLISIPDRLLPLMFSSKYKKLD